MAEREYEVKPCLCSAADTSNRALGIRDRYETAGQIHEIEKCRISSVYISADLICAE